ncbi:MAG: phage portal protein [Acidobacteria bacterium]|nr:MAG: phage portal protein [Acidobacteriota bacterium]
MSESRLILPEKYQALAPEKKEFRGQAYNSDLQFLDGVPQPEDYSSLAEAYNTHVWVYAATRAIASNYAGLDWKAYRRDDDDQYEEIIDHPMVKLLHNPNPYMSGYNLREFTSMSMDLTGNAYWALEFNGKDEPQEIWPIPTSYMQPVASATAMIDHYLYKVNGVTIKYGFNEVIHHEHMNPVNFLYGQGSLEAVKQSVITDIYASVWNKGFFKNAARPDAVFESEEVLGEDVRKRVLAGWYAMHRGSDKRGKTALLEGGLKLREMGWKHADMEFVELRKQMREEILAAFGVPPIMCGVLEYANYANAKEQTSIFWKHTMIPRIKAIQDKLSKRARQLFLDPSISIESDTGNVEALRVDEKQRADTAKVYWQMGVPLNQLIDKFDLPFEPVEGGDESMPTVGGGFGAAAATGIEVPEPKAAAKALPKPKALPDKAVMDAEWKAFDLKLQPLEDRFATDLRFFFKAQQRRILASFEAHAPALLQRYGVGKEYKASSGNKPIIDVSVFFDHAKERKKMREAVHDHIVGPYVDFATAAGKYINPAFNFKLIDPHVLDWLHTRELELTRDVTDYTMERISKATVDSIQEALEEGLSQGDTIKEIAARIDDVYQLARESRSELIARTETLSASNMGTLAGMKQAGAEGKRWLHARGGKFSREYHEDTLDGMTIPVEEKFDMGHDGIHMDGPGDPAGGPGEICNCRCTIRPVRRLED